MWVERESLRILAPMLPAGRLSTVAEVPGESTDRPTKAASPTETRASDPTDSTDSISAVPISTVSEERPAGEHVQPFQFALYRDLEAMYGDDYYAALFSPLNPDSPFSHQFF